MMIKECVELATTLFSYLSTLFINVAYPALQDICLCDPHHRIFDLEGTLAKVTPVQSALSVVISSIVSLTNRMPLSLTTSAADTSHSQQSPAQDWTALAGKEVLPSMESKCTCL